MFKFYVTLVLLLTIPFSLHAKDDGLHKQNYCQFLQKTQIRSYL